MKYYNKFKLVKKTAKRSIIKCVTYQTNSTLYLKLPNFAAIQSITQNFSFSFYSLVAKKLLLLVMHVVG